MRFYVPTLGDIIHLSDDWTFDLYWESRNIKFAETMGFERPEGYGWGRNVPIVGQATLPKKTQLKIARIYIRGTASRMREFDSITFTIADTPLKVGKKKVKGRFWVKLRDANRILCELTPVFDEEARSRFAALADEI